ncbi:hypothetical protein H310_06171 [Aphanomyces invadans]|uniref:Uncharacterized protein n=1 Tax=Aphanomyces invadans TaxID=157072 RepID=A0A024U6K1_9STRA|nr:hypothetical protein H310_06171 [Aphanomyces invadans]ETW01507.1 hypothetical protein H310_06171 [Aphanomyces invadans]|eukprot:XP_008869355.1 hypothetical protein H310_06171 [Aphanomyces invadans]
MAELTNAQRQLVANARARKEGKALSEKLKEQAEAERHDHLASKKRLAQQRQKPPLDNKLAIRFVKQDLAQFALHKDWKKKRHRKDKTRASTVPDATSGGTSNQPDRDALDWDDDSAHRRPPRYRPPNAWAKLYEVDAQEVEREKQDKRNAAINAMHENRMHLMHQEAEKQRRRQIEAEHSAKYFEQQEQELAKYKEQVKQMQIAKEEKQKQTNAEFTRMVAETQQKRERQKKAKMHAELREVDNAKASLEAERLRLEEVKRVKAIQVEQVKIENQKLQDAKRAEKLRMQEHENAMTQEYQKRLAAQEQARKDELQKTYERQEKRVTMALLNVVSPEEKARLDEIRAAAIQAAERNKDEARLEEKRRKQRELDILQGAELRKQQEDKRKRLEAERQAAAHIDAIGAQDALAAEMAARAKQAKKDAMDREYRAKLAQQMAAEHHRKVTADKWSVVILSVSWRMHRLHVWIALTPRQSALGRMTKDPGALRRPTFTVRDGYHLDQVNHTMCSDVERRYFPELIPPSSAREDVASRPSPRPAALELPPSPPRRRSSVLDCPQTLPPNTSMHRRESLKECSPIASWLIFRHDMESARTKAGKLPPFLSTPTSPPTSGPLSQRYAQPLGHVRHRHIKPSSKTSLLPNLPIPSRRPSGAARRPTRRTRYDTENSMIRKRTVIAVADPHSLSLGARILHFKIAPHELQAVVKREEGRKRQHIADHGTNLVARNKLLVVTKPSNQEERFDLERQRQEASKARAAAHHQLMASVLASGVDRWGARKKQAELVRARHHWARKALVVVALGKAAHAFHALYRASETRIRANQQHRATKRIQHFWRRKSQAICLSHVTHALLVIQKYIMKWVRQYRFRRRRAAVHVIITSIEELQEAKFRRCILKYRHCIHVFQSMWRGWMTITDARIKLLLLLWAKLEKKALDKGTTALVRCLLVGLSILGR